MTIKELDDEITKDLFVLLGMPRPKEVPKPFCTFTLEPGDIEKALKKSDD